MVDYSYSSSAMIPDEELVKTVLKGETRPFEVIIRRYNQRLYRIGMSILNNDAETEDAMQAAYINAYEHLAQFQHRSAFGTWLTRIMINQCYEQKRKRLYRGTDAPVTDTLINMKTPVNLLVNKELSKVLESAIAQLPEKYRLVFILREIDELSVKETAGILAIEETNVKVRLNRAKLQLQAHLAGYMKDHVYNFHLLRCDRMASLVMQQLKIT